MRSILATFSTMLIWTDMSHLLGDDTLISYLHHNFLKDILMYALDRELICCELHDGLGACWVL